MDNRAAHPEVRKILKYLKYAVSVKKNNNLLHVILMIHIYTPHCKPFFQPLIKH